MHFTMYDIWRYFAQLHAKVLYRPYGTVIVLSGSFICSPTENEPNGAVMWVIVLHDIQVDVTVSAASIKTFV